MALLVELAELHAQVDVVLVVLQDVLEIAQMDVQEAVVLHVE